MSKYSIYPSIGIARVGNSPQEYYIACESPQIDFVPPGGYRDARKRIKRMGCRFRVYEFDDYGVAIREITSDDAVITWDVHLVNKKAARTDSSGMALNPAVDPQDLTIDSGVQSVAGINQNVELGGQIGPAGNRIDVKLGNLLTDFKGRLVVLGGHGQAASWTASPQAPDVRDNPDWYDDTSDGPVRATIAFPDGTEAEAEAGWIIVGSPDYAHPVVSLTTLYDIALDRSEVTLTGGPGDPAQRLLSFTRDIYPVLHRCAYLQWNLMSITALKYGRTAMHGHGYSGNHPNHPDAAFLEGTLFLELRNPEISQQKKQFVFEQLKDPAGGGTGEMPVTEGVTLTPTQYQQFRQWKDSLPSPDNTFTDDWDADRDPAQPPQPTLEATPVADQPDLLNRAALEFGVGAPLDPGVEAGKVFGEAASYMTLTPPAPLGGGLQVIWTPFRFSPSVTPGDVTEDLPVPWQAGLNRHFITEENLWPGARPVLVQVKNQTGLSTELWTRPFNNLVSMDIFERQQMADNLDMIAHWAELGFIARDRSVPDPQYIETERTL